MGLVRGASRLLSGVGLGAVSRLFDRLPLQCSLYVTDRCNLACAYCTEHDNRASDPAAADVRRWIRHVRDLGVLRIALVGGEPLLRHDIADIVSYCREVGLATSLTTNGLLLTPRLIEDLDAAGLQVMQVSVDRVTPSSTTRKAFNLVAPKLEAVRRSRIDLHLTGVICADTLSESRALLDAGVRLGIPTEVRLVHAAPDGRELVAPGDRAAVEGLLLEMLERKRRGQPIHTTTAVLRYQLGLVRGEQLAWTCAGGYKVFFVSSAGRFAECGARPSGRHILEIRRGDLAAYRHVKPCQQGCGVYCVVNASLLVDHPVRTIGPELSARARRLFARFRREP